MFSNKLLSPFSVEILNETFDSGGLEGKKNNTPHLSFMQMLQAVVEMPIFTLLEHRKGHLIHRETHTSSYNLEENLISV